jgi:hypothetical protein
LQSYIYGCTIKPSFEIVAACVERGAFQAPQHYIATSSSSSFCKAIALQPWDDDLWIAIYVY